MYKVALELPVLWKLRDWIEVLYICCAMLRGPLEPLSYFKTKVDHNTNSHGKR